MLTIACVNTGDYQDCGRRYVETMRNMVSRHLTLPHRFVCLTDDPIEGMDCIPATEKGWWAKLELFKHLKGKTAYFDLDTVIVGNIDEACSIDEPFVTLGDFRPPHRRVAGAFMTWDGDYSWIYRDWKAANWYHPGGDDQWLQKVMPGVTKVNRLLPGHFMSYKFDHCRAAPKGRVVVFQRSPKPHEIDGWVQQEWR